jgi:hypothetical protein
MQPGGRGRFADGATLSQSSHAHVVAWLAPPFFFFSFFSFFQQVTAPIEHKSRPQKNKK